MPNFLRVFPHVNTFIALIGCCTDPHITCFIEVNPPPNPSEEGSRDATPSRDATSNAMPSLPTMQTLRVRKGKAHFICFSFSILHFPFSVSFLFPPPGTWLSRLLNGFESNIVHVTVQLHQFGTIVVR